MSLERIYFDLVGVYVGVARRREKSLVRLALEKWFLLTMLMGYEAHGCIKITRIMVSYTTTLLGLNFHFPNLSLIKHIKINA
jgi:hypothetical protein